MMNGDDAPRLNRSYERNLSWCRVWLAIGIAVATLTFTFVVEQRIQPLTEPRSADGERAIEPAAAEHTDGNQLAVPDNRNDVANVVLFFALILTPGTCFVIALRFSALYKKDDVALSVIRNSNQQEESP